MVKSKYKAENSEDELMRQRLWCKHNQHIKNFHTAQYRALKKHATPNWLTEKHWHQIKSIYEEAKRLTKVTGIPHQVDHIYPLNGENGSGLHVPWNLQILTANENNCKNNKVISIYLQS
jgi:5-methylcytosine-specific restriction endonuclease McrA